MTDSVNRNSQTDQANEPRENRFHPAFTDDSKRRMAEAQTKHGFYTARKLYRNGQPFTGMIEETRQEIARETGWDKIILAGGPMALRAMRASRAATLEALAYEKVRIADEVGDLRLITPELLTTVRHASRHASEMQDALEAALRVEIGSGVIDYEQMLEEQSRNGAA